MSTSEYVGVLPDETEKQELHKSIRSWGIMLLIVGGLSIFANGVFDPAWGILLISVAILSWKVKTPAIFIVFSVIMGWAAISNIFAGISGEYWWLGVAVMQAVWTVSTVKQYKKYRHLQAGDEAKVLGKFGKASGILSIIVLVLPVVSCVGVLLFAILTMDFTTGTIPTQAEQWMDTYFNYVFGFGYLAVLALGLGIAANTSKGNPKGWATAGIVMSSIILAGMIGLMVLGTVGSLVDPGVSSTMSV